MHFNFVRLFKVVQSYEYIIIVCDMKRKNNNLLIINFYTSRQLLIFQSNMNVCIIVQYSLCAYYFLEEINTKKST